MALPGCKTQLAGVDDAKPVSSPTPSPSTETGFIQISPTVTPLSETSVRLAWTPPSATIVEYRVVVGTTEVAGITFDKNATSGVVTGIPAGSSGTVVVQAIVTDAQQKVSVAGAKFWTPYGAVNQDNVNSYFWNDGGTGGGYTEAAYLSPTFSLIFRGFYVAQLAAAYDHLPIKGEAPTYNFQSGLQRFSDPNFSLAGFYDTPQVWSDGSAKVAIAQDWGAHRVLLYNRLPTAPGMMPDVVLGQSDFAPGVGNRGLPSPNATTMMYPAGVCFNGTTLYVADAGNNRILGWNGWPTSNGQAADFVIGQSNFTANAANPGGVSKSTLSTGGLFAALDCQGGRLIANDSGNHRILIWNTAPTSNVPANVVVGQATSSAAAANGAGGIGLGGLDTPSYLVVKPNGAGSALIVSEWTNHRVVQWDSIPTSDGAPFDRVYAQPTATANTANAGGTSRSLAGISHPWSMSAEIGSDRFWVSDWDNGRLVIFRMNHGPSAIDVFDQANGTTAEYGFGTTTPTRVLHSENFNQMGFNLDNTSGLFTVGAPKIWRQPPTTGFVAPDFLQGSTNVTSAVFTIPASAPTSISGGFSLVKIGNRTYWSDSHRILSKTGNLTGNNSVPDIILGAKDMFGGNATATTFDRDIDPGLLVTDGAILYAVDGPRIVGYNQASTLTTSNLPIDFALGQATRLTRNVNDGGVSASSLSSVGSAEFSNHRLVVTDKGNNRVLIWNAAPTTTGAAANVVLGQATFSTATTGTSLGEMNTPCSATVLNGKLLVADFGNKRILVWNQVPTVSGTPADYAFDPTRLTFSLPAWFNPNAMVPQKLQAYDGKLFLGQADRILVVPDIF